MLENKFTKNARPIRSKKVLEHYNNFIYKSVSLNEYSNTWRYWLNNNENSSMLGLEKFSSVDYIQGTTQAFDHFILRHCKTRKIAVLPGEFQYHRCISKDLSFEKINPDNLNLSEDHALIISFPFSGTGKMHFKFEEILTICDKLNVPVLLDLAYWGISNDMVIRLENHPCIQEVVSSLSKPFFPLAAHRIGIRFSKIYLDDGISMLNEVNMQNHYSMSLGVHFMHEFPSGFIWHEFKDRYFEIIYQNAFHATETIIFALSDQPEYEEYNRGVPGLHRICVSLMLDEL